MTYCFAFKLSPDGVGVIADQRISMVNSLKEITVIDDSTLKIYKVHEYGMIAIAGNISQLEFVLEGLGDKIEKCLNRNRFDYFISHCQAKFNKLLKSGLITTGKSSLLSVIYADARRRHSKNCYRLVAIDFDFDGNSLTISYRPNNKETFVDIGWFPSGRQLLSNAAMQAIDELESRCGNFTLEQDKEMESLLDKIPKEIRQNMMFSFRCNSDGPPDSTYRRELRKFINQHKRTFNHPLFQFGPIMDFTASAERAIVHEVEKLRFHRAPLIDSIGARWCHATLTAQRGVFIHPEGEVMTPF